MLFFRSLPAFPFAIWGLWDRSCRGTACRAPTFLGNDDFISLVIPSKATGSYPESGILFCTQTFPASPAFAQPPRHQRYS